MTGRKKASPPANASRALRSTASQWTAAFVAALLISAVLGLGLWRHVREQVLHHPQYQLQASQIEVSPPPPWVHGDPRHEVFQELLRDGGVSVLDADLAERVAHAFALHPWVYHVERVQKFVPARVRVDLLYRRPVLIVASGGALRPVDIDGVLLPLADFAPTDLERYPLLSGASTAPLGPEGTRWGDPLVGDAAQVADAVGPLWRELKLAEIRPASTVGGGLDSAGFRGTFELLTHSGTRIVWGHAPGSATLGEATADEKCKRLKQFAEQHGSLDSAAGVGLIDVQSSGGVRVGPRTVFRETTGVRE